jgi:DNA ligase-1
MIELLKDIQLIEKTSGKKKKEMLFNDLLLVNKDRAIIIRMALDPSFPMYIGEATEIVKEASAYKKVPSLEDFAKLMIELNGGLRGNEAIQTISRHVNSLPEELREYALRLFRKNLRIGCEWPTYLRLTKTTSFGVILAKDINKVKNLDKKLKWPAYVQPKLDGYRCIAMKVDGKVQLFTRNGKTYQNFPSIIESLSTVKELDNYVLDGEIMSDDFQSLQRTAFSYKKQRTVGDVYYLIFDAIPLDEWNAQQGITNYSKRLEILDSMTFPDNCQVVDTYGVENIDEVYTYHQQFCDLKYEGTMLKMDTPYEFERTENLLKVKDMKSMDCRIVNYTEGVGNFKGTLGSVVVLQENERECSVGSGFDLEERAEFWRNKEELIGSMIEVQYQELSKDGIMRFPVFKRFRDDKE